MEEQFYLVWPLLLVGWLAWAARRKDRPAQPDAPRSARRRAEPGLVRWSLWATYESPTTAYFSTLTRAWELGVGSALGIWMARGAARCGAPRWLVEALGAAGLLAILLACLGYSPSTPFPGYQALLPGPRHGRAPVRRRGRVELGAVSRLLSVPPARVVGDWSYSLYLWHWPILRIAEDNLGVDRASRSAGWCWRSPLIFGLSALTYRYVEEPFRRGRLWARPRIGVALYPLSLAMVLVVAVTGRAWIDRELGISGDNPAITTADFQGEKLSKDPHVALVQASTLAAEQGQPVPSDLTPAARAAQGHRPPRRLRLPRRHPASCARTATSTPTG